MRYEIADKWAATKTRKQFLAAELTNHTCAAKLRKYLRHHTRAVKLRKYQ
jgi:hypothetical protein